MTNEDKLALRNYRKERFAVSVSPEHCIFNDEGDFDLRITHNGNQWQAVKLNRSEALKVITALQNYLNGANQKNI